MVLRSHNVEFNIGENLARNEPSLLKRKYLELLSRRLKKYELQTLSKVDFIGTISEPDREIFRSLGCRTPMAHIPFGMDFREGILKNYAIPKAEDVVLFHVGSMDWIPHQEAFRWFLTQVWPTFHQQYPSIQLHLAGANMPECQRICRRSLWLCKICWEIIAIHFLRNSQGTPSYSNLQPE